MNELAIETKNLTKTYNGINALKDLNLKVAYGQIFGLLGHNGAGKTTTVNILTTLLEKTSGTASVNGFDISAQGDQVRKSIGYLPENVQFYDNLTLQENLKFFGELSGLKKPDKRIGEVLEFLNFTGHEKKRLGTFSKGMRQRVGIAQAILHNPKILFLDEPTSGLDPQGVKNLREIIINLNREFEITIFMNTHLLSEVTKTCTHIGILHNGRLVHTNSLELTLSAFPEQDSLEEIYLLVESQTTK